MDTVRWLLPRLAALLLLAALALVGGSGAPPPAAAASNCTGPGSDGLITCTYGYTGREQTFTVPTGVSKITVSATGAAGAAGQSGDAKTGPIGTCILGYTGPGGGGGQGAVVTGDILVTGGQTLYVEVGGVGQSPDSIVESNSVVFPPPPSGGFNGGGAGGSGGGADGGDCGWNYGGAGGSGGGASDIRTCSKSNSNCPALGGATDPRLIVAAGGGGGGGGGTQSESAGFSGGGADQYGNGDGTTFVKGGAPGDLLGVYTNGVGGNGGNADVIAGTGGGGGGGGGWYGGGGGDNGSTGGGAGGGGGSNLVPAGGSAGLSSNAAGVVIQYRQVLIITSINQTMTYGQNPPTTYTVSYSGFINGDTSSVVSGLVCNALDLNGRPVDQYTGPGVYYIQCRGATAPNYYSIIYKFGTLTINPAPLTITAKAASMTYGGTVPAFDVSYSGFLDNDDPSEISGLTCHATDGHGTTVSSTTPPGTYQITCGGASAMGNAYKISYLPGTLTINKAPLTVIAPTYVITYGDTGLPGPTSNVSYSGFVNGDTFQSSLSGILACGVLSPPLPAGSYPISCSGLSSNLYDIAYQDGTLIVAPATMNVIPDDQRMVYGSNVPDLTFQYHGFVNGDTAASLASPVSCTTTATSSSPVGTYRIDCGGGVDDNYTFYYAHSTLTVTPAALAIAADNQTMVYGSSLPKLTASYSGLVNGDSAASLSTAPSCTTTATASSPVGSYDITCNGAADGNYTISYTAGKLTITPAPLTITANDQTTPYGTVPSFTWTSSGWVNGDSPSSLTTSPTCGATVNGSPVSATTAPGSYAAAISCQGAVDANYTISYASAHLTIDPLLSLDVQGLPSSVPHQVTLDGQTVNLPISKLRIAYGSSHSYSFPQQVTDASGTVYFTTDAGFSGPITANQSDTAVYQTASQQVQAALTSGGITTAGLGTALTQQFNAVQADIAAGNTAQALSDLHSFASLIRAQSGKSITPATAQLLLNDAQLTYAGLGGSGTV